MARYIADESLDPAVLAGASCAFGVFDGLHEGHRYIIGQARATADSDADGSGRSVVITFDVDPDEVFHPDRLRKVMTNAERLDALEASGADDLVVLPFTPQLYQLGPDAFLDRLLGRGVPAHLHVGEDFRFGARAAGTVDDLRAWAAKGHSGAAPLQVHAHPLVSAEGAPITSTRIRALLEAGDIKGANELLGHPYAITEMVHPGRGEGREFGFATANLHLKPHDRVLGQGVYAGFAVVDGHRYPAAISVGVSPTFADQATADMEAHILDFDGDLAGQRIQVGFLERLRPMVRFDSTEALIAQVKSDIEATRRIAGDQ